MNRYILKEEIMKNIKRIIKISILLLSLIFSCNSLANEDIAKEYLDTGDMLNDNGKIQEAHKSYLNALNHLSSRDLKIRAFASLTVTYTQLEKYEKARKSCEQLLSLAPGSTWGKERLEKINKIIKIKKQIAKLEGRLAEPEKDVTEHSRSLEKETLSLDDAIKMVFNSLPDSMLRTCQDVTGLLALMVDTKYQCGTVRNVKVEDNTVAYQYDLGAGYIDRCYQRQGKDNIYQIISCGNIVVSGKNITFSFDLDGPKLKLVKQTLFVRLGKEDNYGSIWDITAKINLQSDNDISTFRSLLQKNGLKTLLRSFNDKVSQVASN